MLVLLFWLQVLYYPMFYERGIESLKKGNDDEEHVANSDFKGKMVISMKMFVCGLCL